MTEVVLLVKSSAPSLIASPRLLAMLATYGAASVTVLGRRPEASDVVDSLSADLGAVRMVCPGAEAGADLAALAAALSAAGAGRILIADGALVVSDSPLGDVMADPRLSTAVLVERDHPGGPTSVAPATSDPSSTGSPGRVRVEGGKVSAVGSIVHEVTAANARLVGLVAVGESERDLLITRLGELSALAAGNGWPADPLGLTALALVRSGVPVSAVAVGPFVAAIGEDPEQAAALTTAADALDEPTLRRRGSARANDGFYSTFVVRRLSQPVTAAALNAGLRPNQVTIASFVVGLAAAYAFSRGVIWATVLGALLLQASLILDCTDGEIARFTRGYTPLGAWLDAVSDRFKEYAAYAGLAVGAVASGSDAALVWTLAAATLALQVFRHTVDFGFAVRQTERAGEAGAQSVLPLAQLDDRPRDPHSAGHSPTDGSSSPSEPGSESGSASARLGRGAKDLSERTNRVGPLVWAKRIVIMPIGERWLVISVVSVLAGGQAVFVALLALGAIAATYTTVGRVLRSIADG